MRRGGFVGTGSLATAASLALALALLGLPRNEVRAQEEVVPDAANTTEAEAPQEQAGSLAAPSQEVAGTERLALCSGGQLADENQLESELRALAERNPDLLRLVAFGQSESGRDLHALELTDAGVGERDGKPTVLILGPLDGGNLDTAALVAAAFCQLTTRAGAEAEVARLMRETTFVGIPRVDPDALPRAVRIGRNFPTGWNPWSLPGAGPYPLVRAEARALAGYLRQWSGLAIVYELAVEPAVEPAETDDHGLRGGSLAAFARTELGAFAFVESPQTFLSDTAAGSSTGVGADDLADTLLDLAQRVPRIALEGLTVTRLGAELWQVDLVVVNRGSLPTGGASRTLAGADRERAAERDHARGGDEPVQLEIDGAHLVAAALRSSSLADFEVLRSPAASETEVPVTATIALGGPLEGGASLEVRLVFAGPGGGSVVARAGAARAGWGALSFVLE